jgi:hypothetical protein
MDNVKKHNTCSKLEFEILRLPIRNLEMRNSDFFFGADCLKRFCNIISMKMTRPITTSAKF